MGAGMVGFGGVIAILIIFLVVIFVFYRIVQLAVNRSDIRRDILRLRIEVENLQKKIDNIEMRRE